MNMYKVKVYKPNENSGHIFVIAENIKAAITKTEKYFQDHPSVKITSIEYHLREAEPMKKTDALMHSLETFIL